MSTETPEREPLAKPTPLMGFIADAEGALSSASRLPLGDDGEAYYLGAAQVSATLAVAERLGEIADLLRATLTGGAE